jgi:4-aminobutyrate--pyruvate transaminase
VVAKALSASFLPISATLISGPVHEVLISQSRKLGNFAHGFTYSGHPASAAVALETLKIYEERDTVGHVRAVSPLFQKRLKALGSHPLVGEARGTALIGGLELVKDKASKMPFEPSEGVALAVVAACLERGVILRAIRDIVAVCPPLIITEAEIDQIFDALQAALDQVAEGRKAAA